MPLLTILLFMVIAIVIGRHNPRPDFKHYLTITLLTLIQVAVTVYHLLTMDMPPLR